MNEFEQRVLNFAKDRGMLEEPAVLLAVSGGADSTALLELFRKWRQENVWAGRVMCVHVNHSLRGADSDGDQRFVVDCAERAGFEIVTEKVDIRRISEEQKMSIETAARRERMRILIETAKGCGCDYVATAHQMDDNAETVIQRISRGTGFRGLGGIWPARKIRGICFIRPLLCVRRSQVERYLLDMGISWRVDKTNQWCGYRRNFIRHRLLPAIQAQSGTDIAELLWELSEAARGYYEKVKRRADVVWRSVELAGKQVRICSDVMMAEVPAVAAEIVRRALAHLGAGEQAMGRDHYHAVGKLAASRKGAVNLPGDIRVYRHRADIVFSKQPKEFVFAGEMLSFGENFATGNVRKIEIGNFRVRARILDAREADIRGFVKSKDRFVEWFDYDKINGQLCFRPRRAGDRFMPLGMAAEKKIGKLLTDCRPDTEIRRKAAVVCDQSGIIWVWPVRISEQVKVDGSTKRILELAITDNSGEKQ